MGALMQMDACCVNVGFEAGFPAEYHKACMRHGKGLAFTCLWALPAALIHAFFGTQQMAKRPKFPPKGGSRSRDFQADGPVSLYGYHAVRAALENPKRVPLKLSLTRNMADRLLEDGVSFPIEPDILSPREISRLVPDDAVHQGAVFEVEPLNQPTLEEVRHHSLILFLDQVTDPHNVGAIIRSATALGAGAIVTTRRNAAAETGLLAKTASGGFEHMPYIQVTNLARALEEVKALRFETIGLDSEGADDLVAGLATLPAEKIALVLGAEGRGLRRLTRDLCDHLMRLDMPGPIKSLNVSNAAALALFACRQSLDRVARS